MGYKINNCHFTKCSKNECNSIFLVELNNIDQEKGEFCSRCKSEIQDSHIVQCRNCQTIINFIPLLPSEAAELLFVDSCSVCSNETIRDNQANLNLSQKTFV